MAFPFSFLVYNCSNLLTDRGNYSECQRFIESRYNCEWCQTEDKCYKSEYQTCAMKITQVKLIYDSTPSVI